MSDAIALLVEQCHHRRYWYDNKNSPAFGLEPLDPTCPIPIYYSPL
ncbi:hypothetical protein [Peribacillus simplex]